MSSEEPPSSYGTRSRATGISEQNIGYQLLKKSGWVEGKGLGASEQGCQTPLRAWQQSGKEGIGAKRASASKSQLQPGPSEKQKAAEKKKAEDKVKQQKDARKRRREELVLIANPKEDAETKRKRVTQVWQAEVDAKASNRLQQLLFQQFNDNSKEFGADSNPLLRKNRLTKRNPLLN